MNYVVVAQFIARPGRLDRFLDLLDGHAAASRAEPGCRVFDVCQAEDRPDLILLYEVYDTESAYLEHRATDHYARFLAQAQDLVQPQDGGLFLSRSVLRRRG